MMYATGWRIEGANDKTGPNDVLCIIWAQVEDGRCQR